MNSIIKNIKVLVPHRISGFFEIVDEKNGVRIKELEKIGSRGAGFNLNGFGTTEILVDELNNSEDFQCKILINDKEVNENAETTMYIVEYLKKIIKKPYYLTIKHNFDLPVGCGFGASGSGALGTVFGMNYALNLQLSREECGRIAHIAEVINRTGLGTVCGQLSGGLCILKEPGYPCVYESIKISKDIKVICGCFGPIHTKSILKNPELRLKIMKSGRRALLKLMDSPNIKTFVKASIEFVKETNLLKILNLNKTENLMNDLNKLNIIGASMNQLGRSIFAICKTSEINRVLEVFDCYQPEIEVYKLKIFEGTPIKIKKISEKLY
ncbi:MAG: pantoate kinase [Promethearchaeia archaeon]